MDTSGAIIWLYVFYIVSIFFILGQCKTHKKVCSIMTDKKVNLQALKNIIKAFVDERDWNQFHSGKNLAMNISIEAAELMEYFLWIENGASQQTYEQNKQTIQHELADILIACICFANQYNIDLSTIIKEKVALIKKKYPIDKAKGKHHKYTYYQECKNHYQE